MKYLVLLGLLALANANVVVDQDSQPSENVEKRGAVRLTPVSGNSISDSPQPASQPLQTITPLQAQQPLQNSYNTPFIRYQQPLYSPHPYSFVAPQPLFHYPSPLIAPNKYQAPNKQQLQYVHPYFPVMPYQTPLMYFVPQQQIAPPQSHQAAQPQPHGAQQEAPSYVMVLTAPQPQATGFQYYANPNTGLTGLAPQQLITFYAGPQASQHSQPIRVYPGEQQTIQADVQSAQEQPIQFVQKQQSSSGPAQQDLTGPTSSSLINSYGSRLQQTPHQQSYKTIIKAGA